MNHMYYWVRHIYDASRKHYLLGRDELIDGLNVRPEENLCEVGCGTARNLIKIALQYPEAHLYGLDVSNEMLKTARQSLSKYEMQKQIQLLQADALSFDYQKDFNLDHKFDKIIFSYALSLIPFWQDCLDHALTQLNEQGELHIVDFTSIKSHPLWIRKLMASKLKMFHVFFETGIERHLNYLEAQGLGKLKRLSHVKDRACIVIFQKN